jgi:hypothetical protein
VAEETNDDKEDNGLIFHRLLLRFSFDTGVMIANHDGIGDHLGAIAYWTASLLFRRQE